MYRLILAAMVIIFSSGIALSQSAPDTPSGPETDACPALLHETNWWRIPIFDAGLCGFNFDADGFRAWCLQHAVTDAASKFNFSLLVGEFA